MKEAVDVVSIDNVKGNGEVHYAPDDIEEFMKQIADEAVLPEMNGYGYTAPQVGNLSLLTVPPYFLAGLVVYCYCRVFGKYG